MSVSYCRESNRLSLSSPKHEVEIEAQPFYAQVCPLCDGLLRAYFSWADGPLNVASFNAGNSWDLQYRSFHYQGYQGITQNSHFCIKGWAYLAFTPAQSLLTLLRDRLAFHDPIQEPDHAELASAGTMLLSGTPCPDGLVLARELVQGKDAFLALHYEAVRSEPVPGEYRLALRQEHLALLTLLGPLLPTLVDRIRREFDL